MKPKKIAGISLVTASFLFISLSPLLSQEVPSGQDPGAQAERFRRDTQEEQKVFEQKKKKPAKLVVPEEKPQITVAQGLSFELKEVQIFGSTVFKPQDFRPIYQPYLNKKVTFKDIEAIIEEIKARYRKKGYLTTTVYLPEQDIKDGVLKIRIAEGKMGEVKIEGNKWFASNLIAKYFHSKKNEILDIFKLQRDILRINKISDLEVKTVISPGKDPQASDIIVSVKDKFPWHIGVGEDDLGTRLTGKYRTSQYFRSTNVSGRADSLFLNSLYSTKSLGESANYTLPIGTYGTRFVLELTYFQMKLAKEYKPYQITGRTMIISPHIYWELALLEDFEANAYIGLDVKSIVKKNIDLVTSDDQLRQPHFGFDLSKMDSFGGGGQSSFSPRFTFGTSGFWGASRRNHPSASREGTGGFLFKYSHRVRRFQSMPWGSFLTIDSQFQFGTHTLPSSEQIQLGGFYSVRGYPEGDYLADLGGSANFDWTFPMYLIPKDWKLPHSEMPLQRAIMPVIFADIGGGSLRKANAGEQSNKFLAGIGGGLKFYLYNNISCTFEWAQHLGNKRASTGTAGPSTFYFVFQSEV